MIATSMSGDPTITSMQKVVYAGQSGEDGEGPGPPDLAGEKNHGLRPTDIAALGSQNAHLFQMRPRLESDPLHDPGCLQREEEETAATIYSIESFGGGGAEAAGAIVQYPAVKRMICPRS